MLNYGIVDTLNTICLQTAIAIENAKLVNDLASLSIGAEAAQKEREKLSREVEINEKNYKSLAHSLPKVYSAQLKYPISIVLWLFCDYKSYIFNIYLIFFST